MAVRKTHLKCKMDDCKKLVPSTHMHPKKTGYCRRCMTGIRRRTIEVKEESRLKKAGRGRPRTVTSRGQFIEPFLPTVYRIRVPRRGSATLGA